MMNFVTAFLQEANPLIDELGLRKTEIPSPFQLYQSDKHMLVISGLGKENTMLAVSFLHGHQPNASAAWLNIGLAGHGSKTLGSALQVVKSVDEISKVTFYPPQIYSPIFSKTVLKTVNQASTEYLNGLAYDMEGSAFFKTASRFSSNELIQSVKIISDNPQNPFSQFDKSRTSEIISAHIPALLNLIEEMEETSQSLQPSDELSELYHEISSMLSFTATQKHQVKKNLQHAFALGIDPLVITELSRSKPTPRAFLSSFVKIIDQKRLFT